MVLFVSIIENISPYFYKLLLDSVTDQSYKKVFIFLVIFMVIKLLSNWLNVLSHFLFDRVLIPSSRDVRVAVFKKIQDLDFAFHTNKNTGSLISAFKRGDGAFGSMFEDSVEIIKIFISLLVMLFFFSGISSTVVLIMSLVFLSNFALSFWLIKYNMGKRKAFNTSEDEISGIITDNLINYETVKFFAKEEREKERLLNSFKNWTKNIWGYGNSFRFMDFTVGP
jgi:ABC-type transport system involved in Fe-S cluster assembly fused permease/ATPase subunit